MQNNYFFVIKKYFLHYNIDFIDLNHRHPFFAYKGVAVFNCEFIIFRI